MGVCLAARTLLMPDIIADRPGTPVIALFWDRESGNLNHLILISFPLARAARRCAGPLWQPARAVWRSVARLLLSAADLPLGKSKNRGFPSRISTVCCRFPADSANDCRRARGSAAFVPQHSGISSRSSNVGTRRH